MSNNLDVLLIGCGNMAKEYAKVLNAQKVNYMTVGRGKEKAQSFQKEMQVETRYGGIESVIESLSETPRCAIVATNVLTICDVTVCLIRHGVRRILVEKPAGMNRAEVDKINRLASEMGAEIFVAYNRRYFSSVLKAKEMIEEDGGVDSFNFEFTEWGHVIEKLDKTKEERDQWFLLNSSHVVDLAFFLGGLPQKMSSYISGEGCLEWHRKCSKYAGAGVTEKGTIFSYQANYGAPGRWAVEILTRKHRLYLKPLEQLFVQNIGEVTLQQVELEDSLDKEYKPGLYRQVDDFLKGEEGYLLSIQEHADHMRIYEQMEANVN